MFGDIGWAEMLLIGVVALVVIGPEDLPQMFRQIGRFTAKIRAMGRDFSRAMDQAAAETGVKDMAKDIKKATSVGGLGLDKVKAAADKFEKWDPIKGNSVKPAAKPLVPAPIPETPKAEVPKVEVPKVEVPKAEVPKVEVPEAAVPEAEVPEAEVPKVEAPKVDVAISAAKRPATKTAAKSAAPIDKVATARAPRKKKPEADPA
jgi:sec-independent protein translocase protein TatB